MVVLSWWLRWRGSLFDSRLFQRASIAMGPLGFVAVLAGWITTEVGRQPWVVYGQMRTADAVSPSLTGADVLASLLLYIVVYLVIFPAGALIMARIVRKGPAADNTESSETIEAGRPKGPVTVELHSQGGA
jgi:cytochrome d ubiquinol oxidase subunit I